MGRIELLKVCNFKSYVGEQEIGPFSDFTAIIGPNGAGKSNLMDAISFVLGLPARYLRGVQLKDLIHRTSRVRNPDTTNVHNELAFVNDSQDTMNTTTATEAWVELVYAAGEGELTDKVDASGMVHFRRTVFLSGTSSYAINDETLSFDEYCGAMASIGIIVQARNFLIFQGDVESMASKNPKKLMEHFERICGSWELKGDYERLEKEVTESQDELLFMLKRKKGLLEEKKQAEQQKEEADKYQAATGKLSNLKTQYALWKLFFVERDIRDAELQVEDLNAQQEKLKAECEDAEKLLKSKLRETANCKLTVSSAEKHTQRAKNTFQNRRAEVDRCRAEKQAHAQKIARLKVTQKKLQEAAASQAKETESLSTEISDIQKRIKRVKRESAAAVAASGFDLSTSQRQKYAELDAKTRQETVETRKRLDELQRKVSSRIASVDDLKRQIHDLQTRSDEASREREASVQRLDTLGAGRTKDTEKQTSEENQLKELRLELKAGRKRQAELAHRLKEVQASLADARDARLQSDASRRVNACIEDMRRLFPGVRGRLLDLCSPVNRKFNLAVDVTLGKYADAIVVQTSDVAKECISYLRQQQVPPQYFLPLDTLKCSEPSDTLLRFMNGPYRLMRDVIRYDTDVEQAVKFACGTAIVADTLDAAMKLRFHEGVRCKVVSLDGTIISKTGNLTGGMTANDASRATRWDEKALRSIQHKRDSLLAEEQQLRARVGIDTTMASPSGSSVDANVGSLINQISTLENSIAARALKIRAVKEAERDCQTLINSRDGEIKELKRQITTLQKKLSNEESALTSLQREFQTVNQQVQSVRDDVFKTFREQLNIASMTEFDASMSNHDRRFTEKLQNLQDTLRTLQNKLEYENSRHLAADAEHATKNLQNAEELSAKYEETCETAETNAELAQAGLEDAKERLEQAKLAVQELEAECTNMRADRARLQKERTNAQRKLNAQEAVLERKRSIRHDMLVKARLEQIDLPMMETDAGATKHPRKKTRGADTSSSHDTSTVSTSDGSSSLPSMTVQQQSDQIFNVDSVSNKFSQGNTSVVQRDQQHVAIIDFSTLQEELESEDIHPNTLSDTEINTRSVQYEQKIRQLTLQIEQARPNLKAQQQYQDVSTRLNEHTVSLDEVRSKTHKVSSEFQAIRAKRLKRFMTAFNYVRRRIDPIYKELTRSSSHLGGGKANLYLFSEDEPFSSEGIRYNAQPPMKRFRDMESLSGGEKTMAALALLFAIHEFKPAPFFVVDEIDAALDNANVAKISNYIRRRADALSNERLEAPSGNDFDTTSVKSNSSSFTQPQRRRRRNQGLQFIVISLKDSLFHKADALIGICRDSKIGGSKTISLDLTSYGASDTSMPPTPLHRRRDNYSIASSVSHAVH